MAEFLVGENMEHRLANSLDVYNNIKDISIEETTKVKSTSNFSATPSSEQNIGRNLEMFQFVDYSDVNGDGKIINNTCNIKSTQTKETYKNVPILGMGLGHLKGVYSTFKAGDLLVVGWLDKNSPVVIGGINDNFSTRPDTVPALESEEALISPKSAGSYIMVKKDDTIKIRNVAGIEIELKGDVMKLTHPDGGFIEIDEDVHFGVNGVKCGRFDHVTLGFHVLYGYFSDNTPGLNGDITVDSGGTTKRLIFENGLFVDLI